MTYLMVPLCFVVGFLVLASHDWIALIPWRKTKDAHWTERARVLFPFRKTRAVLMIYVPLIIAAGSGLIVETSMWGLLPRWLGVMAGAVLAGWFVVREIFPEIVFRSWLYEIAITCILRLGLWMVLIGAAFSMPDEFNLRTWLTLAGVIMLQVTWPSLALWLLRGSGIVKPPNERLRNIVKECAQDGGPPVRSLWQVSGVTANAVALPLTGTLLFHEKLMEILTDEEVATVCVHELGHLAESGWILLGRYLGAMAVLPLLLIKPAVNHWELPGFIAMMLLVVLWSRLSTKLVHRMEKRADATATSHQSGEGIYARALEKLYQQNRMPAVMPGKTMSHPHLYDRMLAAGAKPEYPRPAVPRKFSLVGWCMVFAGPFALMAILNDGIADWQRHRPAPPVDADHRPLGEMPGR